MISAPSRQPWAAHSQGDLGPFLKGRPRPNSFAEHQRASPCLSPDVNVQYHPLVRPSAHAQCLPSAGTPLGEGEGEGKPGSPPRQACGLLRQSRQDNTVVTNEAHGEDRSEGQEHPSLPEGAGKPPAPEPVDAEPSLGQ